MLNLFRSNQLILGVFLLVYALALRFWLLFAIEPTQFIPDYHLLSGWLWEQLKSPVWLPTLFTTLVIWIQALLINSLVARNRLAPEINLFPGLFYILVCSALPAFQEFAPIHLANTFLIIAIGQVYQIYKQNRCMDHLFNAGLVLGISSIFFSPYLFFILPILFGLSSLRAFNLKEWLAVIIGGGLPILWLLIIGYLNDNLDSYWMAWTSGFSFLDIQEHLIQQSEIIGLLLMGMLILTVILNYNANIQKTIIEVRKKIDVLYWMLFFGFIVAIFSHSVRMVHLLTVVVPCGILLSFLFTRMKRSTAQLVHLFLFFGVLLYHYLTFTGVV